MRACLVAIISLLCFAQGVFAQATSQEWAIQLEGQSRCTNSVSYIGSANPPVIGTDIPTSVAPSGSTVLPWVPVNGDQDRTNYAINGALLEHYSSGSPTPDPVPYAILTGSSGAINWTETTNGGSKEVVIVLGGYVAPSVLGATLTFPTAFLNTPSVIANTTGLTISTISTTSVKIPSSAQASSGTIVIKGI
jgi:hypothetical protein